MARKPFGYSEEADDTKPEWPVIGSYTTENGLFIKVYKAAYAVASSNKYSVRPGNGGLVL